MCSRYGSGPFYAPRRKVRPGIPFAENYLMMPALTVTPANLLRWILVLVFLGALVSPRCAVADATNAPVGSRLVEFAGTVEVTAAGTNDWRPAGTNQWLQVGDRLRTGPDSRATLQLSDRSTIRINQSTIIEIRPPVPPARHRFNLQHGMLYFLDREQPADIEFETPLTSGAIRGTEFLLDVAGTNAATRLVLIDGAVALQTATEVLQLTNGQQAWIQPRQPAQISAMLPADHLIQWSYYYPAVLNPTDLAFSAAETNALADSLAAYAAGDVLRALAVAPDELAQKSAATRVYYAALKLAVGQVAEARELFEPVGAAADPLRELVAAVKFQSSPVLRTPTNSSDWLARSYLLQSQSKLPAALSAAQEAARRAPDSGFAWVRVAELELGAGHRPAAQEALARARKLAPCNAQALALEGYLALADYQPRQARDWFAQALAQDSSLPNAWIGRGLARAQQGDAAGAREDLQIAATLEPGRGLFRSYLAKAWSQFGQDALAEKDLALAKHLDPGDPTAWLYSALHEHQTHQVNAAVRDLERSAELNDNRSIFRSRLQLDQDLAMRSADLAAIYDAAGLTEVGESAAGRAVEESYSDFSGHLFRADSLQAREDPSQYDLRLETARESERLLANLLAPPGGGNLSQLLSQQDHLQYFGSPPIGGSTFTGYGSRGDWEEAATVFGQTGRLSYALDGYYLSQNGQRANNDLEEYQVSLQTKVQVTAADSAYLQAGYAHRESGDVARYYDPQLAIGGLRVTEKQAPNLLIGWNHEWSPGSHTLLLLSRLTDRLSLTNPQPSVLLVGQDFTGPLVRAEPFTLQQDFDFTLYSAEVQQIWETPRQALIVGGRYQHGTVDTQASLTHSIGTMPEQSMAPSLERVNGYGYYQWRPVSTLRLIAGLSYDRVTYPRNVDLPPVQSGEEQRSLLGPKVGVTWQPWENGWLHAAWTRSLGGLFFDNSIRLEPAQVAGFNSAFRSLVPESVAGLVPGTEFETWSVGFDQKLAGGTYFGAAAEWLTSDGSRDLGAFTNAVPGILTPDGPASTPQTIDFRERAVSAYLAQLLGDDWSTGLRYRLSEDRLRTQLPDLAGVRGVSDLQQDERAVLQHAQFFLRYNHPCGFFAEWSTDWFHQNNHGYSPALAGDDFWQQNLQGGYVFAHRRAELRLGVLNLADQDYALNPLNPAAELPRHRTFVASLRVNF